MRGEVIGEKQVAIFQNYLVEHSLVDLENPKVAKRLRVVRVV